jgi:hypothetical protein
MAMTMPGTPSGRPRLVRRNSIRHSWTTRQRSFEQIAVVAEVRAEHLGDAEHEMPVWHQIEDALGQQRPEELDLLLVAGRAEPAALAGEGQQAVLLAVIAPDAGEAAGQVPALEELLDHLLG